MYEDELQKKKKKKPNTKKRKKSITTGVTDFDNIKSTTKEVNIKNDLNINFKKETHKKERVKLSEEYKKRKSEYNKMYYEKNKEKILKRKKELRNNLKKDDVKKAFKKINDFSEKIGLGIVYKEEQFNNLNKKQLNAINSDVGDSSLIIKNFLDDIEYNDMINAKIPSLGNKVTVKQEMKYAMLAARRKGFYFNNSKEKSKLLNPDEFLKFLDRFHEKIYKINTKDKRSFIEYDEKGRPVIKWWQVRYAIEKGYFN